MACGSPRTMASEAVRSHEPETLKIRRDTSPVREVGDIHGGHGGASDSTQGKVLIHHQAPLKAVASSGA